MSGTAGHAEGTGLPATSTQAEAGFTAATPDGRRRYTKDGMEFGRVVNLSDAVFAIALTLLVLTLDELAVGPLLTFALSFFLVASAWWHHHRIFAQLAWLEPGLVAVNMTVLATVALVPFPTSLVGADPSARSAVLPFVIVFTVLSLLYLALIMRADMVRAWLEPLPRDQFRWLLADWSSVLLVYVVCLAVALWAPVAALIFLAVGSPLVNVTVTRKGPQARRAWF